MSVTILELCPSVPNGRNLAAVVAGVKETGITQTKFAGGHGSIADYAPLAALEEK